MGLWNTACTHLVWSSYSHDPVTSDLKRTSLINVLSLLCWEVVYIDHCFRISIYKTLQPWPPSDPELCSTCSNRLINYGPCYLDFFNLSTCALLVQAWPISIKMLARNVINGRTLTNQHHTLLHSGAVKLDMEETINEASYTGLLWSSGETSLDTGGHHCFVKLNKNLQGSSNWGLK